MWTSPAARARSSTAGRSAANSGMSRWACVSISGGTVVFTRRSAGRAGRRGAAASRRAAGPSRRGRPRPASPRGRGRATSARRSPGGTARAARPSPAAPRGSRAGSAPSRGARGGVLRERPGLLVVDVLVRLPDERPDRRQRGVGRDALDRGRGVGRGVAAAAASQRPAAEARRRAPRPAKYLPVIASTREKRLPRSLARSVLIRPTSARCEKSPSGPKGTSRIRK